jgi:hypothetical protein
MSHVLFASRSHRARTRDDAWTPADNLPSANIAPHVWYAADKITGLVDSQAITTWPDAGPNGDDIAQAVGGSKPFYKTNIVNSQPVARFDGSADFLSGAYTNAGALTQPFTIFAVAALDAAAVNDGNLRTIVDGDDITNRALVRQDLTASPDDWAIYAGTLITSGDATDSNWTIFTALFNGASSQLWEDGTSILSGDAGAQDPDGLTVGAKYDGTAAWWDGDIAEIIVYDANLGAADRSTVQQYLADKYGISTA